MEINISKLLIKPFNLVNSQLAKTRYIEDLQKRQENTFKNIKFMNYFSIINDSWVLNEIKNVSFTDKDVRASWFGSGIPLTTSLNKTSQNLANWATEHLMMYVAFMIDLPTPIKEVEILDVGCGTGYATKCLACLSDSNTITGIDYDKAAINCSKIFNSSKNIEYICDNFITHNFKKKYDYIFALEILEHIPAKEHYNFINKCLRLLKTKGLLFISTPNALDEVDGDYSHIGLLNRERAGEFIKKYQKNIIDTAFIDNRQLLSCSPNKFLIRKKISEYEHKINNYSHFHIVMNK